jgi:hypothetical protein
VGVPWAAPEAENLEREKLRDLFNFRHSPCSTPAEVALRACLAEVSLTKNATDAPFTELQRHYSERDLGGITWLNASDNYFNRLAKPLGQTSDELTGPAEPMR